MTSLKIYGLIGCTVKHSFSPAIHNAAFRYLKDQGKIDYDGEYRLFEVKPEELEEFLLNPDKVFKDTNNNPVRAGDVLGFNITIPHKVKAREILEREFPFNKNAPLMLQNLHYVKISGAINTARRVNDKLEYFNTDARGFFKSLEEDLRFDTKGKNVLIVGCGGAGRAVIAALSWRQNKINKIFIYDVSNEAMDSAKNHFSNFQYIMDKIKFITVEQMPEVIKDCQLLVNTSPVGMKEGDGSVVDKKLFHQGLSVYDVVYNRKTQLIKDAESLGRPAKDGLGMLLYQGAEAFELWTGQKAPIEIMRQALQKELEKCQT